MAGARNSWWTWTAAILALAFDAVNGLFAASMGAFRPSLDELQHLSLAPPVAALYGHGESTTIGFD